MSAEAIKAKSALVEEIAAKLKGAQSAVVVEYRGLSVAEMTELRNNLRAEDVELKVYKNSLVQRATVATEYEGLNAELTGPNAIALGNSDAVAPARVIAKFAKDHEALVIKAAVVEGKLLTVDEVKEISKLPNREGMYSMLLGMLQAPVSKFARVVKAVAEAKPEDGSAAAEEAAPVEEAAPETPVVEETAEETKEDILAYLEEATILELNDLVKAIEEKFDVTAAAPVAVAAAGAEEAAGEPANVTVTLTEAGGTKVAVIKAVREITGLGLVDAKGLVDKAPSVIKENIPAAEGAEIKEKLEAAGASVEVK